MKNHAILDNKEHPRLELIAQRCVKDFRLAGHADKFSYKKQLLDDEISQSDLDIILHRLTNEKNGNGLASAINDDINEESVTIKRISLQREKPTDDIYQNLMDLRSKVDEWCCSSN